MSFEGTGFLASVFYQRAIIKCRIIRQWEMPDDEDDVCQQIVFNDIIND